MWSELNDTSGQLQRPWMSTLFEDYEALKLPLVVRHPFSDIRLIEFVLAVPDYVLFNKRVLRNAMQGKLPAGVLSRPKEGLPGDLHKVLMASGKSRDRPSFENISSFVDPVQHRKAYEQLIASNGKVATWSTWLVNAPIALAYWMNNNTSGNLEK